MNAGDDGGGVGSACARGTYVVLELFLQLYTVYSTYNRNHKRSETFELCIHRLILNFFGRETAIKLAVYHFCFPLWVK